MDLHLNCDLAEWEPPTLTAALMPHIHRANIACGGHAGTPETIKNCHHLALQNNVQTGAHPGLPNDKGRTLPPNFTTANFTQLLTQQLQTYLKTNTPLHHIKLHGALYHLSETNPEIQKSYLEIAHNHQTKILCLANGNLANFCQQQNFPHLQEAFLDRTYLANGNLTPRTSPNPYLTDLTEIKQRITQLQTHQSLTSIDNTQIPIHPNTLCIHSDTKNSLQIAQIAHQLITKNPEETT